MPRQPRNFETGSIYHVVNRGVEKRDIFLTLQDYSRFILGLEFCNDSEPTDLWTLIVGSDPTKLRERLEQKRKLGKDIIVKILGFALMPNHFHLVVQEIVDGGVSRFMQKLGGYTTYFNKQHDRVGSLFQSRFKAVHIQSDSQLHTVFAYVHTNPIELWEFGWKERQIKDPGAAIKKLNEYRFSSYLDYIGKQNFQYVIDQKLFLNLYGNKAGCRRAVEDWVLYKAGHDFGPEIIE